MSKTDTIVVIAAIAIFLFLYSHLQQPTVPSNFQTLAPPPDPSLEQIGASTPDYDTGFNLPPIQGLTPPNLPPISFLEAPPSDNSGTIFTISAPGLDVVPPWSGGAPPGAVFFPVYPPTGPTFNPPVPQLANEPSWIQGQMQQAQFPNASLTRTPLALNSQNATGTWGLRGYFPSTVNYVNWSGSEPAPDYVGAASLSLQHPLSAGQQCILYSLTDQGYPQTFTGHSGDGLFYNFFIVGPGDRYVGVIWDNALGIIASTEFLSKSSDPNYKVNNCVITDQAYYQYPTPLLSDGTYITHLLLDYVSYNLSAGGPTGNPQLLSQSFTVGPYESQLVPYVFVPSPPQQVPPILFAQTFILQGLILSFQIPISDPAWPILHNRTYTYDQALAIIASMSISQAICEEAVLALCQIQSTVSGQVGWWYFDVDSTTGAPPDPYFRVGAAAWCVYALCLYCLTFPGGQYVTNAKSAIGTGISAIQAFQSSVGSPQGGLVQLGYGEYVENTFVPGNQTPASCEHNIDYWFALDAANQVFPGTYSAAALVIKNALISKLWGQNIYGLSVFTEGIAADGTLDTADALDINSWGGLWWAAQTDSDAAANATLCFQNCQAGFFFDGGFISGYEPYNPNRGYPGASQNVWSEGTAGVALLLSRLGMEKQFDATIDNMIYIRQSNGGWQYAFITDTLEEIANWPGVSGTAWVMFCLTPALKSLVYKGYN